MSPRSYSIQYEKKWNLDRGDRFIFDFETNLIFFGSKSKIKLLPRLFSIQFERKSKLDCGDSFLFDFEPNRI